jgi:hypothetical protein
MRLDLRNLLAIIAMFGGLGMMGQGAAIARCGPHNVGTTGPEYPCTLYLSNIGGQLFYAGIIVEIVGIIFYRRFPPAKKSDSDKEYRLEPMKIDDDSQNE